MNPVIDPSFKTSDSGVFVRTALRSVPVGARAAVVNRTHRVVRERAKIMQEKRSRDRSLMLPLIVCSILLILSAFAVWSGLYQSPAVETVQADVAALADVNNHLFVVFLWFVPVSLAVLATVYVRRSRSSSFDDEAR
jgi:NADH:ubiquinone oxidoreductase subunit 6 (subunit J)